MSEPIQLDILGQVLFTALFLSLSIVPATMVLARKVGAVDTPKGRSSHSVPTTRLGGLGIAVSLIVSSLVFLPLNAFAWAFLSGLLVIVVTGVVDDIVDIGPRWKFAGQIAAAATFVLLDGGTLSHLGNLLGSGEITLESFAVPFTIFCMVGGMNAFNLSDGLDGLAAGMAAIVAVFFAYFSWHAGAADLLLVCVALLGALLGFLRYNSYPAKLFMGDCGSLTLGYVLAALLVNGSQREGLHVPLAAWAMVVALPLLDTLLVMARRMRYGHSPFLPDRTHLHHRLLTLGLAHPDVVAVLYAAMALFGTLALVLQNQPDWFKLAALCVTGGALFGCVAGLQRIGFALNPRRQDWSDATMIHWPILNRISKSVASSAVSTSVMLSLLCLPAVFFPLPDLNQNEALALLMLAGVVVIYSLHRTHADKGMLHGSVYVSIFALCFLYNLAVDTDGHWPRAYLTTISVLAAVWVAIRIVFHGKAVILKTSGSELLMVFLSWFLPFVLLPELSLPANVVEAGRLACLQVLPFMLAIKIYFNVQPKGARLVMDALSPAKMFDAGRTAILQVRPMMRATRILFNFQSQGNQLVVGVLSGSMAVAALRGLVA